ncbi:hypothetical protein CARN8_7210005 [mine drainage metagenome]|uniref:Uncharacterized protein n=1 Tax=mine drainage metagenome TaxID=410659 RepID=A0A3P3ZRT6_9ZZZZ
MFCSGRSASIPICPECANEQIRSAEAGMLLNLCTAKEVPVHAHHPRNIRFFNYRG